MRSYGDRALSIKFVKNAKYAININPIRFWIDGILVVENFDVIMSKLILIPNLTLILTLILTLALILTLILTQTLILTKALITI